jgi:hypothetical protein
MVNLQKREEADLRLVCHVEALERTQTQTLKHRAVALWVMAAGR